MDPSQPKRRASVTPASPESPAPAQAVDQDFDPDSRASDFTCLALWMAGTLAGLVTAALIRQAPLFRALARCMGLTCTAGTGVTGDCGSHKAAEADKPTPEQALPMLADAIVGNTKSAVARVFGPPRSAVISAKTPVPSLATFWLADTWYYPLPRNGRLAMAIQFNEELAREVAFLRAPGL